MADWLFLAPDTIYSQAVPPVAFDQKTIGIDGADFTVVTPQQLNIRSNTPDSNVELIFQDFGNIDDRDMNHAWISVNCTDVDSEEEDCDFRVAITEAGGELDGGVQKPEMRLVLDADAGITIGSDDNNTVELKTDGFGDGELILPSRSVGSTESLILTESLKFCGNGPGASGTVFISPALDDGLDNTMGSAHCDTEDSTVEANADEVAFYGDVEAIGMACHIEATGTGTVTFGLRDDASTVSSVGCSVNLSASEKSCEGRNSAAPTVASGSLIDVVIVNGGSTDLSATDVLCTLFVTR